MNAEICMSLDNRQLEMYIVPSSDTERVMLEMYGELFGFTKDKSDIDSHAVWRRSAGVVSQFQNATWDGTVTSSARKP